MKNSWMTVLLVFSLTVNLAAVATLVYFWRQYDRPAPSMLPSPAGEPSYRQNPPWQKLNLPHEKKREIVELRRRFQHRILDLRMSVEDSRRQVMQQMLQQTIDNDSLNASIDRLADKQIEMEKMTVSHLLEMRSHLTDEQWQTLLRSLERERRGMQRPPFARRERPQQK